MKKDNKKYNYKTNLILEPFDTEVIDFVKNLKSVSVKISTSEYNNIKLIIDALKNFKKIFINCQ